MSYNRMCRTLLRAATLSAENEKLAAQLAEERKRREGLEKLAMKGCPDCIGLCHVLTCHEPKEQP